tara:strand:+ start:1361 stop:2689 length:1329 start_codon:yes stop_codon:yes gene_type:complete
MQQKNINITKLNSADLNFEQNLINLRSIDNLNFEEIYVKSSEIVEKVNKDGDKALIKFTNKFDNLTIKKISELEIKHEELDRAFESLSITDQNALIIAKERIEYFHEYQKKMSGSNNFSYMDIYGNILGQKILPIEKVGIYVPGGKASYPSSVLMNAIPAKVAGVNEIVMVVPCPKGYKNPTVLAAAKLAKVDRVYSIGGAQAVGALAFGTETINKVDKIVGPGNAYVAAAKRNVFGSVGIDMIAGPSEILIIADGSTDPNWVAMDLFSQAEHDELAQSILISPDLNYINKVEGRLNELINKMSRESIIRTSLANRGALIKVKDMEEACKIANEIAPEHLEIASNESEKWGKKIKNAGAIFMGCYSSESLGDYCAGPNHVLPTSGTARFSSPLGIYDFQKRSSIINVTKKGALNLGKTAAILANCEGLDAHAKSAELRFKEI